jgi:hypothetical protein
LAARQARQREHAAAPGAKTGNGHASVVGAAWFEAAARTQQRAQQALVQAEQDDNQSDHGIILETAFSNGTSTFQLATGA